MMSTQSTMRLVNKLFELNSLFVKFSSFSLVPFLRGFRDFAVNIKLRHQPKDVLHNSCFLDLKYEKYWTTPVKEVD